MAGLVPAIHNQPDIEIGPIWIFSFDQIDLPITRPLLERLFASNRKFWRGKLLRVDEAVDLVPTCEASCGAIAVLPDTFWQVARDADVQCAMLPARKDVHVVAFHLKQWLWIAGTRPAMTRLTGR
jgi:hypothetical protein